MMLPVCRFTILGRSNAPGMSESEQMESGRRVCDGDPSRAPAGDVGLVGDDAAWTRRTGRPVKMRRRQQSC
jgi:hypothetical protein